MLEGDGKYSTDSEIFSVLHDILEGIGKRLVNFMVGTVAKAFILSSLTDSDVEKSAWAAMAIPAGSSNCARIPIKYNKD